MDAQEREEFRAALALRHTPGLGPRTWKRLLERWGSALEAAQHAGEWGRERLATAEVAKAFGQRSWRDGAAEELAAAGRDGHEIVLWTDDRFPRRLKDIPDPPLFLYCTGRTELLAGPCVAVVGARKCTTYGLEAARSIGEELSRAGLTVVSGLALGIDRQAHLAGLEGVGSSIAVLGTGPDVVYPASNGDVRAALVTRGLIMTEFPPGTPPDGRNFPTRNRIISGLSLGVLVVEATEKSGSLITAKLAADQGREVFALPGPLTSPTYTGCHALIRQGATLVGSAQDIVYELSAVLQAEFLRPVPPVQDGRESVGRTHRGPAAPAPAGGTVPRRTTEPDLAGLAGEERAVVETLLASERLHIDELCRRLDWDAGRVGRVLVLLEVRGLVRKWPGMFYTVA